MRKTFLLAAALLTASAARAEGNWFVQGQGSFNFYAGDPRMIGQNLQIAGFGGSGSLGYAFDENFSLAAQMGYAAHAVNDQPPGQGLSLAYLPVELVAQYQMQGGTRPYGFLGAGVAFNTLTADYKNNSVWGFEGAKETDFILSPGLGVAFDLSPEASLFVQAKADLDFTSTDYIQLLLYKQSGLTLFIPVEFGLRFSLG